MSKFMDSLKQYDVVGATVIDGWLSIEVELPDDDTTTLDIPLDSHRCQDRLLDDMFPGRRHE